jgi:hypothetical protein
MRWKMGDTKNQTDMNNKVDKLFKEKLETDTLQPSAKAWEKVESHLSKKNKMAVWLRVAAAIALLGALTFVIVDFKEPKKEIVKEKIGPGEKPAVAPDEKKEERKQHVAEAPAKKKSEPKKVIAPAVPELQPEPVQEQQVAIVEQPAPVIEEAPKKERAITLVYSLPSIKKETPAVAQAEVAEVKKTGFERVLEIAKEVKNADNPLGELREAKDDILAFEFKKDKDKNKKHN